MYRDHSKTPVIVGAVFHVLPENVRLFEELLHNSPYVKKLIIFKESNKKIWLVERDGDNDTY